LQLTTVHAVLRGKPKARACASRVTRPDSISAFDIAKSAALRSFDIVPQFEHLTFE
jgi:hypothetical protein